MIRIKSSPPLNTSLELTPLIDIIFIVIVFLLLTANTRLLSLPVKIPTTESAISQATAAPDITLITLQPKAPIWAIDQQSFDHWEDFKKAMLDRVEKQSSALKVHIAAARDADVEVLIKLLALLNQHKVINTQILIEEENHAK